MWAVFSFCFECLSIVPRFADNVIFTHFQMAACLQISEWGQIKSCAWRKMKSHSRRSNVKFISTNVQGNPKYILVIPLGFPKSNSSEHCFPHPLSSHPSPHSPFVIVAPHSLGKMENLQSKIAPIPMPNVPFYQCPNTHTQNSYLLQWENYAFSCPVIPASVKKFTLLWHEFNFHHRTCGYLTLGYIFIYFFYYLFCQNVS